MTWSAPKQNYPRERTGERPLRPFRSNANGSEQTADLLEGHDGSDHAATDKLSTPIVDSTRLENTKSDREQRPALKRIVSSAPCMKQVFHRIQKAANVTSNVLITGESGTGKELVAEAIHHRGCRREGPFVTINMAAVPTPLIESELFGHVKGSFTGASEDRIGRFEEAHLGTLFIDEIGDLPVDCQAKLLRILEDQSVIPVGGGRQREVDVRIIAATNRNLAYQMSEGLFREDLFYRLNVIHIALPPLREREGDVRLLVEHFAEELNASEADAAIEVDDELMDRLVTLPWPGNVRQLRNCVESMIVLADSCRLTLDDFPTTQHIHSSRETQKPDIPDNLTLSQLEELAILKALRQCDDNRTKAAKQLGISVRTLQRKLARFPKSSN